MPIFEYTCVGCQKTFDEFVHLASEAKDVMDCECGGMKTKDPVQSIAKPFKSEHMNVDRHIGADADSKWKDISSRREYKEKALKDSKSESALLKAESQKEYRPLNEQEVKARDQVAEVFNKSKGEKLGKVKKRK